MSPFITYFRLLLPILALVSASVRSAPVDSSSSVPAALTEKDFIGGISAELSAHYDFEGELSLELLRTWTPPSAFARSWQVQVSEFPSRPSTSMLVRCRVSADGAVVSDGTVFLHASLWRQVWVTRQPLSAGSPFDASLLDARRADTLLERDAVPASINDGAFVFLRPVGTGHFVTWQDIGRRSLVRKGDLVDVTASEGALTISMKALAMQNGAQGEVVTVRNVESHKDFTAIVIEENHVQIRF